MELPPELQEKKIFLIEGLKRTYKGQYDAIQPLPYVKDRLYCVDKVFVEGGVEVCLAPELTRGTGGSWESLESYKSIYTDFRFKSKRRIIQGEPGYGKSTLTLQLAYDWCNDVSDSPMNHVEILILLRLRQLGSVKCLFRAIKLFLLYHEPRVSKHEIENIIHSCSSVHITLDGYDEYPGRDSNVNDDVHRIIKRELFADFDVSLTTRYLPEYLRKETKRAKLTGFDDKARDEYIRKAVVGNNDEAVEKIKQRLYEISILADLCQVPLIFVMFAHMAHDERDVMKFKSVTQFFKHIIRCFYDHLNRKRKLNDRHIRSYLHEMEHHELDKIAFEGLNKKNQQLSWIKTEFCERVGLESYYQYIAIGILVEEDVVSDDSTGDNVLFTREVRFYHKLFCEWYAAHHLVTLVKNAYDINKTLRFLDPVDLQYLFRFACGLDPDAGKKLINHLKRLPGGDTFAILCILEQSGDIKDIMDSVKYLCSRDVKIQEGDSALLQRSTTQLLEIASNNDIPISCLHLEYSSIKFEGDTIILHSGISLPILPTVEKIHIAASNTLYGNTGTLTDIDLLNFFHYGMKCGRVKKLMFDKLPLPTSFSPEAFTDIMKTQNIQVRWRPFDIEFHLDLQNGHWEVDNINILRQLCSDTVNIRKSDDTFKQKYTIMVINIASRHEIPISCLHLEYSSIKFEGDTIMLHSGISLPMLPTVENIHIAGSNTKDDNTETLPGIFSYRNLFRRHDDAQSANQKTLTEKDILNWFRYGMKCRRIKELMFCNLQLPISVSPETFTNIMKTRNIKVRWRPFDIDFHLDLQNGHWEVDDIQVILNKNSGTVSLSERNNKLQDTSTLQLLEVARNHDIPVSCLHLEYSSIKFEGDTIKLHSGIPLPILPAVQKIHIAGSNAQYGNTGTLREKHDLNMLPYRNPYQQQYEDEQDSSSMDLFTEMETFDMHFDGNQYLGEHNALQVNPETSYFDILSMFRYGMKCGCVKELMFDQLNLPTSFSPEAFTDKMKTEKIQVRWRLFDIHFHLDLETGHWEVDNINILRQLCSDTVNIRKSDDTFKQKYTIMVINIASRHEIPISCLHLEYSSIKFEGDTIMLHSGISLPMLPTVENIHIAGSNTKDDNTETLSGISYGKQYRRHETLTEKNILKLFRYGMKCRLIKELMFCQLQLPTSVSPETFTNIMRTLNIRVRWRPFDIDFHLDLQNGHWEVDDIQVILNKNSGTVSLSERNDILQDMSTLQLLEVARNHDIPISCLHLEYSSIKFEGDTLILHSGIPLPILPTVENIHIDASNIEHDNTESLSRSSRSRRQYGIKRTLTTMNVMNLFHYGMKCGCVKELMFNQFQLPTSVSPEAFTDKMKTQKIQVRWRPFDIHFHLDLETGHWEVDNNDTLRQLCSDTVYIKKSDGILKQTSTIILIHIASSHKIPISCLYLEQSFSKFDTGDIILHSGLHLSCLVSVKKVVIDTGRKIKITETEVVDILIFVQQSHMLEELQFDGFLLPPVFFSGSIPAELKSRDIKVFWKDCSCSLNLQSGIWEVDDVNTVRKLCTTMLELCRNDSELSQRRTIKLLENASYHDIPISCLYLYESFSKIDAGDVILHSGLRLSCPVSVKKVEIHTERGRELTETEVVDILMFVQQSHMLKKLEFFNCLLPQSISAESILSKLNSRKVKVSWYLVGEEYKLNLQSGRWMDRGTRQEMTDTKYNDKVTWSRNANRDTE